LADPSEEMVKSYLADGHLYAARWDGVIVGTFVLLELEEGLWELKNIAVAEEWQGKGVGKVLIREALERAVGKGAKVMEVGTGNSSVSQLAFYQKAGFRMKRIVHNYFTLNYDNPIFENDIQCRDLVVLSKDLGDNEC